MHRRLPHVKPKSPSREKKDVAGVGSRGRLEGLEQNSPLVDVEDHHRGSLVDVGDLEQDSPLVDVEDLERRDRRG